MDNSVELERSCDVSVLLKSKKEHYEKEMERLISYIGEEFRVNDPLSLIGKRFRQKEEEFSTLRRENQELLQRTKNLAEDIHRLRASQDSLPWDDLHVSLERTQKLEQLAAQEQTALTDRAHNALSELDSQLEQVRAAGEEEASEYDRVLEWAIAYLTRDKAAWRLTEEMRAQEGGQGGRGEDGRGEGGEEEMVLVPRRRYEQLIKIYSINIAEISINELRQKLKNVPAALEQRGINYVEEAQRTYYQNYADIAKEADVKDLHQLFEALARKVGFEREWARYHLENASEAVKFQGRVNSILEVGQAEREEEQQEEPASNYQFSRLLGKLSGLVQELPFARAERREWEQLSAKIREDRLVGMESLVHRYQQLQQEQAAALIAKASALLHSTLALSLQEFSKLVRSKLRVREASWGQQLEELTAEAV